MIANGSPACSSTRAVDLGAGRAQPVADRIARSMSQTMSSRSRARPRCASCRRSTPARGERRSSSSCRWVVEAGWMIERLGVADVGQVRAAARSASMKRRPASRPPSTPKVKTAPGAARQVARAPARVRGCRAGPGSSPTHARVLAQERGQRDGVARTCRSIRSGSVSSPCRSRKALNGREHRPEVAHRLDARLHDEGEVRRTSRRSACRGSRAIGSVMPGKRPSSQGNVPPSTITPPIVVPWPPMNLVAECDDDVRRRARAAGTGRAWRRCCRSSAARRRPSAIGATSRDVEHVDARVADRLGVEQPRARRRSRRANASQVVRVDEARRRCRSAAT